MNNTRRLQDTVAIVTGAGTGIGRAIACRFAAEGAHVVVGTRGAADGEETVAMIRDSGGSADLIVCDVGQRQQATDLVQRTLALRSRLDILVHNAGIFPWAALEDLRDEDLDSVIDVNLKACFWLSREALPALKSAPAGGRILVTSSVSGNHANAPGLVHYSASKAGVTGFVRNLALDLAPFRITVNAVEPGFIVTERKRLPEARAMVDATVGMIPMRRGGDPSDIAALMAFLASPEAGYITGQSIVVDGGLTLGTLSSIDSRTT